ncbi:MAG: TonB-dependent receptor [Gammaproteobacteria bacterium]|nr:TonB-dependent receptor [Gammaproteobacteria bacterium]MYE52460.1 TonB-dependent receptor [Gammaproteobacteria bacterium]
MPTDVFKKTPIAAAVSLAIAGGVAHGQEDAGAAAQGEVIEEVVVVGIRQSLKRSMDLKRNRDGVVDAITAEDIGDFPDSNLAESLQRITGVSIDRERGEGARVTVRGFGPDFNLVLLNGRQMPTAGGGNEPSGRSFDFGNLASEGISSVEVYKSGQANVPTGGIGSTINIRTTRPLDNPGMTFTAAASALMDSSTEEGKDATPEISALFSNTFADDTVGIALSAVRQERNNGANTANVSGWRTFQGDVNNCWCGIGRSEWGGIPPAGDPNQQNRPGDDDLYSVPQAIGYELAEYDRVRTNGQLTLQWQPSERLVATLDYTYSEVELERTYNNLSAWFNFGGQETLWTDGPQATPLTYTENSSNSDYSMGAGQDAWQTKNGSTGLNLIWDVTDRLSLEFDYHDSTAKRRPDSPFGDSALLSTAAFSRDKTTGYFGKDLPVLELTLGNPLSPDDMIVTGSVFTNNYAKMGIEQAKVAGSFEFDFDFIESVDFGIQLTEVNNRSAGSVVQRDAWGGVTQPGAIADLMSPASSEDAFDEVPGGGDSRRQTDFYTWEMDAVIDRTEALMASGDATIFMLTDMGDCGTGLCTSSRFTSDRRTQEETEAAYIQVNMGTDLGPTYVDIRVGLRYEQTDIDSQALSPAYTAINWVAGNELTAVQGDPDFTELKGDYDVFLPNFDFKIDLTDSLVGRFSYSETMTRPNYGDIQGGQTINSLLRVDGGTGNRGNPNLLPFESQNIDVSFEYYYGEDSYVAVGYFHKDVDNFIGTASVVEDTFGLPHPALGPLGDEARAATGSSDGGTLYSWILENRADAPGVDAANGIISGVAGRDPASPFNLTVPVNIEQATMKGWEFVIQHTFGDSGFGFIANATLVEADVGYDNFSLEQQFVLTGLSDSANLIAFYDKNDLSVRVAWNWRDDFLAGTGQANVGAGPPTHTADYQQLDLSVSYWFTDQIQAYFDVLNLTDETTHVYGRDKLQTLFAGQNGPRYNLGIRYKF